MENTTNEFDGIFRFTNPTDEDFVFLWNNKEYIFPAGKMTPMLIQGEPPENIQEIRKRAAYKLALREFHKGEVYNKMKDQGRGHPATYNEKILEPMIEQCLNPLPLGKLEVKELPKEDDSKYRVSKAVTEGTGVASAFEGTEVPVIGQQF